MKIDKCIIEIEDMASDDFQMLESYLKNKAGKVYVKITQTNDNANSSTNTSNNNLNRLKKFMNNLTDKQLKVFKYFMNNPGPVDSNKLKEDLPFLKPHGAMPGVFSATKRWISLGGKREDSPFVQIDWDKSSKYGIYRGLTTDEIEYLKRP
ncbi:hypothetical protein CBU02nite_37880 [Clostridium butyricum]|uniref:Uncharacterized protein n=1 Tax=Clostridium butyricum TaxID=1492 RepID=A0A512TSR9_CLOBU|nr:hypothetical protein [Clostridium butyricum]NOW25518.1 hypothetical protein [Clostridium butyricum]GEQ23282.1 hypothetical protein CBU02nite_37880 [Clostridium butyricum]